MEMENGNRKLDKNFAHSRSASDNIRTINEKTESVYVQKFHRLINGTLSSGKFLESPANKREAVCAYLASGFLDQSVYYRYPTFQALVSYRFV